VESIFAWGFGGLLTGLREGVEAALIVGIIASYLVKIGRADRLASVWFGVAAAIASSIAIGVLAFVLLGSLQGTAEQIFAGTASLLAVVILTYMLFWMRKQAVTLGAELRGGVDRAVASASMLGLSLLAFTAVIREGIETALFLLGQTTAASGEGLSVVLGALVGLLIAAGIGVLIFRAGLRLNLSAFFNVTGAALVVIASGLLSYGVHEFIEVGLLPALINPVLRHLRDPAAQRGDRSVLARHRWLQLNSGVDNAPGAGCLPDLRPLLLCAPGAASRCSPHRRQRLTGARGLRAR